MAKKMTGIVAQFGTKGYGFITGDDGEKYFVHQKNVITIPQKALLQNPLGTIVFVEKDGVATVKPVMVGNESGDKFIVAGGSPFARFNR